METCTPIKSFESVVLPHLCAGHRLAYRLMRHQEDAEDVVQEACLRAFRYFRTFTGGDSRAWFLTIVRNTPSVRLITLVGPGGVGKTRLALELAGHGCRRGAVASARDHRAS